MTEYEDKVKYVRSCIKGYGLSKDMADKLINAGPEVCEFFRNIVAMGIIDEAGI
jgi:hypothetical protein